jgi:hypothetical protein
MEQLASLITGNLVLQSPSVCEVGEKKVSREGTF